MTINPNDYPIQPNDWLVTKILYEGTGKAIFKAPAGFIEGPSQVEVDETGKLRIELKIDKFDCEEWIDSKFSQFDTLMWLLNGIKPQSIGSWHIMELNPHNTCSSFQIEMCEGTFTAVGPINYNLLIPMIDVEEHEKIVVFRATYAVFKVNSKEKPKYWVFPLNNFVSPSLQTIRFLPQHHDLNRHPLRILPPPALPLDLPPEEQEQAIIYANRENCFIPFKSGQSFGFIESLPDYQERANRLQTGGSSLLITAVMVGNIEEQATEFNNIEERVEEFKKALCGLPLDHLHLLSLASGSLVGIPWIELRDQNGGLVYRLHTWQWQGPFANGHVAIDDSCEGGIGLLLTKAPPKLLPELRAAIRSIVKGSQSTYYLEDNFAFLARAADTLTKQLRNEQLKASVKEIVQAKRPNDAQAIIRLARELDLKDFSVLHNDKLHNDKWWIKLYKKYRNQVIHEGYLPISYPKEEYIPLWMHLQDLLIRIVLKKLSYDGEYRKFIPERKNCRVDWVQESTPINELWHNPYSGKRV
jgi:hypothetical protein